MEDNAGREAPAAAPLEFGALFPLASVALASFALAYFLLALLTCSASVASSDVYARHDL